jgi:peptide/nickel transport system substrate-binding protein
MTDRSSRIHPGVVRAQAALADGRIGRREFLRLATLLGVSLPAATLLAACGGAAQAPPVPTSAASAEPAATAASAAPTAAPAAPAATTPPAAATGGIKRGGILKVGIPVQALDHPARLSWVEGANQLRFVFEYLTETDAENITHPYLLDSWEASDDLREWRLNLRQDVTWTNGDQFNADDVIFNFNEWLNPDVGSSILGLWEGFLTPDGIERVDDFTVTLKLTQPKLDVPESLFHYPALILHRSFAGDATTGQNPSTGPYLLKEYSVGERVVLEARTDGGYWQQGVDGQPLPYLDGIEFIDLGEDQTAAIPALQAGEIHTIFQPTVDSYQALRDDPNLAIESISTAQVRLLRMRVDQPPFDKVEVRNAIKKVQDRQAILDQAYFGEGDLGHDVHVAPIQPEFAPMEVPAYDPEGARALLEGAGVTLPLSVKLSVATGWTDVVAYGEALKAQAEPAGINIELETMPTSAYWDLWTETPFGVTPWTHRPLGVMLLPLAYIADSTGKPVPWNETRWVDEEFSTLLLKAQGLLDIEERRAVFAELQRIQQERGAIGVAWWQKVWNIFNPAFQNVPGHPTGYFLWREAWYDPERDPTKGA